MIRFESFQKKMATQSTTNSIPDPLPLELESFTDEDLREVCCQVFEPPISVECLSKFKKYVSLHGGTADLDDPNLPQWIFPENSIEAVYERRGYHIKLVLQEKKEKSEKLQGIKYKHQDDHNETFYDAKDQNS